MGKGPNRFLGLYLLPHPMTRLQMLFTDPVLFLCSTCSAPFRAEKAPHGWVSNGRRSMDFILSQQPSEMTACIYRSTSSTFLLYREVVWEAASLFSTPWNSLASNSAFQRATCNWHGLLLLSEFMNSTVSKIAVYSLFLQFPSAGSSVITCELNKSNTWSRGRRAMPIYSFVTLLQLPRREQILVVSFVMWTSAHRI